MIEPWDSSRKKAKELRFEHWGSLEEVKVLAAPLRQANNRKAAMECLKEISLKSPFTSRSGLSARLSKRSLGKLVCNASVVSSFCPEAHYLAAANIDKLYSNAIEPWKFELNPYKENTGLKARRYLFAPLEYNGKFTVVKITVKVFEGADLQNKLYSIEAIFVDLREQILNAAKAIYAKKIGKPIVAGTDVHNALDVPHCNLYGVYFEKRLKSVMDFVDAVCNYEIAGIKADQSRFDTYGTKAIKIPVDIRDENDKVTNGNWKELFYGKY